MECGKERPLCGYICRLFGTPHLERYLSRVAWHNEKADETLESDAADKMVHHQSAFISPFSLPRASKGPPAVIVGQGISNSRVDGAGRRTHVTVRVTLDHSASEIDDRRDFLVCTAVGTSKSLC
jgi:hypothetical protein